MDICKVIVSFTVVRLKAYWKKEKLKAEERERKKREDRKGNLVVLILIYFISKLMVFMHIFLSVRREVNIVC